MRMFAIIMFGILCGMLSAVFGINVMEEPIKYICINGPAILCFGAVVHLIDK